MHSFDASSQSHDEKILSELIETMIIDVGYDNIVQVMTDNGANYKLADALLEQRLSWLFWTTCVVHCLHLMLEDIGKIPSMQKVINQVRRCITFIYMHGRILHTMREKTNGMNLVRTGATRFATAFLTLQSLLKRSAAFCSLLFWSDDWCVLKLAKMNMTR